jgi:hypothetical protein
MKPLDLLEVLQAFQQILAHFSSLNQAHGLYNNFSDCRFDFHVVSTPFVMLPGLPHPPQ